MLLESYLSGRAGPLASWGAENIHIFVVASLALVLAAPFRGWASSLKRTAGALIAIFGYALCLTLVQLQTVAERGATATFGVTVTTHAEKIFLNWANRGLIMVGMLALPALLFLLVYVASMPLPASATSSGRPDPTADPGKANPRRPRGRKSLVLCVGAAALLLAPAAIRPAAPDPGEILSGLRRVVALNPRSAQAHFSLGLQLEDQGMLPEAQGAYEASLRLQPGLTAGWFNLGNVYFKLGSYDEAARCYRETLSRDARHASARNNLGNALFKEERYAEAADAYRAALEIDEAHASTHKNLGETLLRLGEPCRALLELRRSAALDRGLARNRRLSDQVARLEARCGR